MDINQIGSYASIFALVVMLVGGLNSGIKRYRKYVKDQKIEAEEFKTLLVQAVDESTTSSERNDANAFVQHVLSQYRHIVLQSYLKIIAYVLWGGIGFIVLITVELITYAWLFLGVTLFWVAIEFWYLTLYRDKVDKSQWEVGKAWAMHLDRARKRKRSKDNG